MSEDPSAEPRTGAQTAPQPSSEMLNRIGSGIVLAVLALGLLYAGTAPFALLVGLAGVLTSFEWSRIVRGPEFDAALVIQILAAGLAALLGGMGLSALGLAVVAAGTILVGLLTFGERPILSALGVLYAGLPAVALLWLRDDYPHGLYAVLFVLAAVVATDVAAFFTGRLVGGPKLAPAISPRRHGPGSSAG
jgi:phosphatidate cytidylyltransferase